jgi:hypothetical protein
VTTVGILKSLAGLRTAMLMFPEVQALVRSRLNNKTG